MMCICILQGNREINVASRVFLETEEITLSRRQGEFRSTKPFGKLTVLS